jgi:hypothetical protein
VFRDASREDAFHGGCPIMNLAIESDDADPVLRNAARKAMSQLLGRFDEVIAQGMRDGEFPEGDARARASLIVASLEGGVLLGNLYKDRAPMDAVVTHLERFVRNGFR